jgi:hypothetical protein
LNQFEDDDERILIRKHFKHNTVCSSCWLHINLRNIIILPTHLIKEINLYLTKKKYCNPEMSSGN